MSMLKRLLSNLHSAVFDTSPDSGVAFLIRHPSGAIWSVVDETLTASVGGETKTYHLNTMTVGQLAGQLAMDGFEVSGLSPEFAGRSASVLVEASGNSLNSNGDRVYAFRDLLRALFGGYARELRTAQAQIGEAIKQMVITQAEGEWLDLWGALYNTPRPQGMADAPYQPLIPQEAFRMRVNGYAIEKAILDLTGQRVHIEEPWEGMFRLDESTLSGTHRFYDGESVGYHLIRPVADKPIVWDGIVEIIERNKAAGVIVLPPEERNRSLVSDPLEGIIWYQQWSMWSRVVKTSQLPRMDDSLRLSNYSIDKNHLVNITSLQMLSSLTDEVDGFTTVSAAHLLDFGPVIYPIDTKIWPGHTGYLSPDLIVAYPARRKTWRTAGKWRGNQTWVRDYDVRVLSRITSYGEGFVVDGSINGTVIAAATEGGDWTGLESWSDATWNS